MKDRIDLSVYVPALEFEEMISSDVPESSAQIRCRVEEARERQRVRFAGTGIVCNADMQARELRQFCQIDDAAQKLLRSVYEHLHLTMRTHDKILKVARTVADLCGADRIEVDHIAQATVYRDINQEMNDYGL